MDYNLPGRIFRLPDVMKITGKSRSAIYADMRVALFPKSVSIGVRAVGWRFEDIRKWLDNRTDN